MARLGEIIDLFEEHRVDERTKLVTPGKRLQTHGLITVAKRGRGSAEMSWLDVSRFMIATMATDHPERAVDVVAKFGKMPLTDADSVRSGRGAPDKTHAPLDVAIRQAGNFENALAYVLEDIGTGACFERELARRLPDFERVGAGAQANMVAASFVRAEFQLHRAMLRVRFSTNAGEYDFNDEAWRAWIESLQAKSPMDFTDSKEWRTLELEMRKHRHGKNLVAIAQGDLVAAVSKLTARKARYA